MDWHTPTDFNLLIGPGVHAERLHFRDVGTQLAVQGRASHTQEDAQLGIISP
jgi:hypothetical protein